MNLPIEVSSSKARGVTDRLTLLIGPPDVFLITIFSAVESVPAAKLSVVLRT